MYRLLRTEDFNTYVIRHFQCDSLSDATTILSDYATPSIPKNAIHAGWTILVTESPVKRYVLANDLTSWVEVSFGAQELKKVVASALPSEGDVNSWYFIGPKQDGQGNDYYEEYLWVEVSPDVFQYEAIGSTAAIDLTGYATETYVNNKLDATLTQLQDGTYSLTFGV